MRVDKCWLKTRILEGLKVEQLRDSHVVQVVRVGAALLKTHGTSRSREKIVRQVLKSPLNEE